MNLYLDSSALVKVFSGEGGADMVRQAVGGARQISSSRLTYVECRGAISRASREGRSTKARTRKAISLLDGFWGSMMSVELTEAIADRAAALTELHPLRASDAVQLASAEAFSGGMPIAFATFDRRLWAAAEGRGWSLLPTQHPDLIQ